MKPSDFIHPEDAAALRQLEAIPGFPTLMKKFYALGYEKLMYGTNMASNIRLSERQLPKLYRHLPPICKTLGIDEPEFYLEMNPMPNAYTFGDSKIFITVTSGLIEMMSDEELDAVLGHECGHILCRHVLYHSVASYILKGIDSLGILGSLTMPIQYAILYWQRKSELSCDRVGSIITSPEIVASTMARLAGGPYSITSDINLEEWAKQGDEYESIRNDGVWNKALQVGAIMTQDHPFAAVRVREILKWAESELYNAIRNNMSHQCANVCPSCGQSICNEWKYCKHCGNKLV
jgi:Zn-dependent protease with chaperone function